MRKLVIALTAPLFFVVLTACAVSGTPKDSVSSSAAVVADKGTIGIALPGGGSDRWKQDGDRLREQLEAAGYAVDLQYANGDVPTQVAQVQHMVTAGDQLLVVAAVESLALKPTLKQAQDANIPVIAYDRLLRETDAVNYYVSFDNFKVGVLQAQALLDGLEASGVPQPWNVELFAGPADDNNVTYFYNGAMSLLQPKIDDGTIKIRSGETDFRVLTIPRSDPALAKQRMASILTKAYSGAATVHGVLALYDGLTGGLVDALKAAGYGTGAKPLPVIAGQDTELASVARILLGVQYSTVFRNTHDLTAATVEMIPQMLAKAAVSVNDTKSYDNGIKIVAARLLTPVSCDKTNVAKTLLDANYFTQAQIDQAVQAAQK